MPGIRSNASVENGSRSSTAASSTPSCGVCVTGRTDSTPGAAVTASRTAPARAGSGTTMSVGALEPLGKDWSSSSWPATASTSSRKPLPLVSPLSKFSRPSDSTSSSATVAIQTRRGRRATRSPICRQAPCVSSVPSLPKCGTRGQNARRPQITSHAGSSVSIASIATATPSAPIGPRPEVPLTSASVRHSSAAITVMPDAKIAGPAVRKASAIASCLSSWRRSSSR